MKPLCPVCSTPHEKYQAHVFAKPVANVVDNKVDNRSGDRHKKTDARKRYMRELMQRIRAIESGRAMRWLA